MEISQGEAAALAPQQLRFTGSGGSYFGIWIVNLLLSILTLGIYSAWAKVRRLQYFYRHTELAGATFDFHGNAISILIGRIIALVLLAAYSYGTRFPSKLTLIIVALILLALPWLLRNSFRFRLYNSSWRGLRFSFHGSVGGAYRVFVLNVFLMVITFYLMAPFFHQRLKAYQHGNARYGRTPFSFHASAGSFYLLYFKLFGLMLLMGAGVAIFGGSAFEQMAHASKETPPDPDTMQAFTVVFSIAVGFFVLFVGPWFQTRLSNLIWSSTRLGEHRFQCNQSALGLMWIGLSNVVLMVLTLGLFYPWAMVRLARFQVESVRMLPASDLQEFQAGAADPSNAIGEEAASVFDFDIAL